jgi:hypothetical protein
MGSAIIEVMQFLERDKQTGEDKKKEWAANKLIEI